MIVTVRTGALSAVLALAAASHAQSEAAPYNFAVQGGTAGYRSTAVRDLVGKSGSYFGVRLRASSFDAQVSPEYGVPTFDFDYLTGSRDGSSAQGIGLSIVERAPLGAPQSDAQAARLPYFGIGVGIARTTMKQKVRIQNGGEVDFKTNTQANAGIFYKVVVGVNFGNRAFIEAGFLSFPKALNLQPGAMMTSIGVKF